MAIGIAKTGTGKSDLAQVHGTLHFIDDLLVRGHVAREHGLDVEARARDELKEQNIAP